MPDSCTTGKIMFYSAKDAKKAVNQQKASRKNTKKVSKSWYICEHCGAHHLTSKSKGQLRRNNKLRSVKQERISFIAMLKEKGTVSWYLANPVTWVELEKVDEYKSVANYVVEGVAKRIVLRNT